ncbi:hypothetical protein NW762_003275 [Fusarium torreyae]|uniref:Uncharacterized protein n=1 Tax=Fusarium torreyae TaxID=1237075 RepID=A0A9W8S858_9HYPO|nr:hypothetical protein NW762_003275 [Fusarium torreyae]
MILYEELQGQGHKLNPGLNPWPSPIPGHFDSIFTYTLHPEVAELALDLGIQPFNDCKVPCIMLRPFGGSPDEFEEGLIYADWLMRNGVHIDLCTDFLKLSAAHDFAGVAGEWVHNRYLLHGEIPQLQRPEITRVLLAISRSQVESRLPCPYMTKPLNRPLAHFLFTSITSTGLYEYRIRRRQKFHVMSTLVGIMQDVINVQEIAYLAKCAIRILTYSFLGVRYLSGCYGKVNATLELIAKDPSTQEEWAEIVDEDWPLIEQANTLTDNLEEEFQRQNVSIAEFLQGHWRRRMREVRSNAESLTDSRKHAIREAGVVLNNTDDSSHSDDSLDSDGSSSGSDS